MQFQSRSMSLWQYKGLGYPHQYVITSSCRQSLELIRLHNEEDVLEQGLVKCVIYLQALRKTQARNEQQLSKLAALPRKKQKKLQQTKRDLEREIKNREQDEKAFLSNLEICQTSIRASDMFARDDRNPSMWINTALNSTLCTPTLCSSSGTRTLDSSWNSWTDETDVLPFRGIISNSSHAENIASHKGLHRAKRDSTTLQDMEYPSLLFPDAGNLIDLPPVPPNTARTQFHHGELDPEAVVFDPSITYSQASEIHGGNPGGRVSLLAISTSPRRRSTDAGIDTLHAQAGPCLEWCIATPQYSPTDYTLAPQSMQSRANSI